MTAATESVIRLTDEELELFGARHPAVAEPFLGRLDDAGHRVALEVAQRALYAHGLPLSDDGALLVPVEVVQLLELRRAAAATLVLIHADTGRERVRYLHDVDAAWLVEDLEPEGVHRFDLHERERFVELVTEVVRPETLSAGHGPAGPVDLTDPPWGVAVRRLDATVWRPGQERGPLLGMLAGSRGAWATCSVPGADDAVRFAPVDGAELLDQVLALLGCTADPGQPVGTMGG